MESTRPGFFRGSYFFKHRRLSSRGSPRFTGPKTLQFLGFLLGDLLAPKKISETQTSGVVMFMYLRFVYLYAEKHNNVKCWNYNSQLLKWRSPTTSAPQKKDTKIHGNPKLNIMTWSSPGAWQFCDKTWPFWDGENVTRDPWPEGLIKSWPPTNQEWNGHFAPGTTVDGSEILLTSWGW